MVGRARRWAGSDGRELVSSPLVQLRTTDMCSWTIDSPVIAAFRPVQAAVVNA
jgi:hypothetical protein